MLAVGSAVSAADASPEKNALLKSPAPWWFTSQFCASIDAACTVVSRSVNMTSKFFAFTVKSIPLNNFFCLE